MKANATAEPEKTLQSRSATALKAFTCDRPTLFNIIKALEELGKYILFAITFLKNLVFVHLIKCSKYRPPSYKNEEFVVKYADIKLSIDDFWILVITFTL